MRMNGARIVRGCAAAAFLVAAWPATQAEHLAPAHHNVQIHVMDPNTPSVQTHSLGDWAGVWWVADEDPTGGGKWPLLVVAFETTVAATVPLRQAHFVVLRHAGAGRFNIVQTETVGPADSDIHFLRITKNGIGAVEALEVFEGTDPGEDLTVHHYLWDVLDGQFLPDPPDTTASLPDPIPTVPASEMEFESGGAFTPFEVTTNSSTPGSSRFALVVEGPPQLTVEAEPPGGLYTTTVPLALSASDPAADVRYQITSDGSEPPDPDANSPLFGPGILHLIPRTTTTTTWRVRAKAFLGPEVSDTLAETYLVDVSLFADSDGDGLPDIWEVANGFDPLVSDAGRDTDGDGWSDVDEMRLGSDPDDPASQGMETRRVRFTGSVALPGGAPAPGSRILTISPTGGDLISDPNHGMPVDPNDASQGIIDAHATTDAAGIFTDARTLGESHVFLAVSDAAVPRVVLHRFVPDTSWALPPRLFSDPGFFTDPNVLLDLDRLRDPNTWFDQYRENLRYDIAVSGLLVDAGSSFVAQLFEKEIETVLPGVVLDHVGIPVAVDRDELPIGNFPEPDDGDADLDQDRELDADENRSPLALFPDAGDVDRDGDARFDGFMLTLGHPGAGLTARHLDLLEQEEIALSVFGRTLQETIEDPNDPTYAADVGFAEDLFTVVGDPDCPAVYETTDQILSDLLDGQPLVPAAAACIDLLPSSLRAPGGGGFDAASRIGMEGAGVLPSDLPGMMAAARAAAHATGAFLSVTHARGETSLYESGDAFAEGGHYRGFVRDLVACRAGDPNALSDIAEGAAPAARSVKEARGLAAAGRAGAVLRLRTGACVVSAALDAADSDPNALANLDARMGGLVYRIDRAAPDPNRLAALEATAAEFLFPDMDPPIVTATPSGSIFTGSLAVSLLSNEPATIHYTLDGSDPVPGGGTTLSGANEIAGILLTGDTTVSWIAVDVPWGNASAIGHKTWLHDGDADAIADVEDNCPAHANPGQQDFDGDALGDACDSDDDGDLVAHGADCRSLDPTLWDAPGEHPIAVMLSDAVTIQWTSLAAAAGPATTYDMFRVLASAARSADPQMRFDAGVCLLDNMGALLHTDLQTPPPGDAFYYAVRGENACGTGIYGRGTDGTEEVSLLCP